MHRLTAFARPMSAASPAPGATPGATAGATADPDRAAPADTATTGGGLRRSHWCALGLSLVLTLLAWSVATRALEQRDAQRFGRQADTAIARFLEQLQRHADILAAAAGLVMASEEVTREEWQRFAATLDLERQFPALSGMGIVRHVPAAELPAFLARERAARPDFTLHPVTDDLPAHLPLVRVTPPRLAATLEGLDLARERHRREAVARAAERGIAQLTAPITPKGSGASESDGASGVVMLVPFYRDGPAVPPEERGARFTGAVAASMLLENLAAGALGPGERQIRIRISDDGASLYDELDRPDADVDPAPLHTLVREVPVHGRRWRFDVHSTLAFRDGADRLQPLLILVGGLCINALLLALLMLHTRADRRLRRAARDLREESAALARSNEKLEAFACVASHDLKAPLRGIRTLVEFIKEDLDDYFRSAHAAPEVAHNLTRVGQQAERADALIEGILDYSGLGKRRETSERVDTRVMLGEIAEMLDVEPGQLAFEGDFPTFETRATRLRQVLTNLIGNAFKYHHDVERAHVRIAVTETDGAYRFSVSDDGPGIDPRLHERIFEPFGTGQARANNDSTGVGLAIVRKSVEAMGGTISIDSAPGRGATFAFDWPKRLAGTGHGSPEDRPEDSTTDSSEDSSADWPRDSTERSPDGDAAAPRRAA